MNEFSILCRVLGSLYYRQPQDPLLVPLFTLIREGKLAASWPLEQDELLERLQKSCDVQPLAADYNALFVGEECSVPPYRSAWVEGASEAEVRGFFSEHGIPTGEGQADHIGSLLLAASWLKIMLRKMKAKRWKRCLLTIFCRGAGFSSAKSKRMPGHLSGGRWRP
jgi:TorA maturation chaperone TorD